MSIYATVWALRFPHLGEYHPTCEWVPADLARLRVPEHRYAVFKHRDHISTIRRTWNAIINSWLPQSGHKMADAPEFERYDENFDSKTGAGGLEIWIPIER